MVPWWHKPEDNWSRIDWMWIKCVKMKYRIIFVQNLNHLHCFFLKKIIFWNRLWRAGRSGEKMKLPRHHLELQLRVTGQSWTIPIVFTMFTSFSLDNRNWRLLWALWWVQFVAEQRVGQVVWLCLLTSDTQHKTGRFPWPQFVPRVRPTNEKQREEVPERGM